MSVVDEIRERLATRQSSTDVEAPVVSAPIKSKTPSIVDEIRARKAAEPTPVDITPKQPSIVDEIKAQKASQPAPQQRPDPRFAGMKPSPVATPSPIARPTIAPIMPPTQAPAPPQLPSPTAEGFKEFGRQAKYEGNLVVTGVGEQIRNASDLIKSFGQRVMNKLVGEQPVNPRGDVYAAMKEPEVADYNQRLQQKLDAKTNATVDMLSQSGIGKEIAWKIIHGTSQTFLQTAITLEAAGGMGGGAGKAKKADTLLKLFTEAQAPAAKFAALVYTTSEGTNVERAEAAAHAYALGVSGSLAAIMPTQFFKMASALALNVGTNVKSYNAAMAQAEIDSERNGLSIDQNFWIDAAPQMILDAMFAKPHSNKAEREQKQLRDILIIEAAKRKLDAKRASDRRMEGMRLKEPGAPMVASPEEVAKPSNVIESPKPAVSEVKSIEATRVPYQEPKPAAVVSQKPAPSETQPALSVTGERQAPTNPAQPSTKLVPEQSVGAGRNATTDAQPTLPVQSQTIPTTEAAKANVSQGTTEPAPVVKPEPAPIAYVKGKYQTTSTKNAVMEVERATRGADPLVKEAAVSHPEAMAEALRTIGEHPNRANEILIKLRDGDTRSISDKDEAVLAATKVKIMGDLKTNADIATNPKSAPEAVEEATRRYNDLNDQSSAIDEATHSAGTVWGRLGALRQRLWKADFSPEAMVRKTEMGLGRKLEPAELIKITKQSTDMAATQDAIQSGELNASFDQFVRLVFGNKKAGISKRIVPATEPAGSKLKDYLIAGLDKMEQAARLRRKQSASHLSATFVPGADFLADHTIILVAKMGRGTIKFGEWSKQAVAEFGVYIKPHLNTIWDKAKSIHAKLTGADPDLGKALKIITATPQESLQKIAANTEKGLTNKLLGDLALSHVKAGAATREELMKRLLADVKTVFPDITEREIGEALVNYGKTIKPNPAQDHKTLRDLKTQERILIATQDALAGKLPKKTGWQPDLMSDTARAMNKELNRIIKESDLTPQADKDRAMRSAEQTARRSKENRIVDLKRQIEAGKRDAKAIAKTYPKQAELEAEIKKLQADLDKKVPRQPMTDAQATAVYLKRIQSQIATMQKKMKSGNYDRPTPREIQLTDEVIHQQYLLDQQKTDFNRARFEDMLAKRTTGKRIWDVFKEGITTYKAIKSGFDVSWIERQGGIILKSHPLRSIKGILSGLKAFTSKEAAFREQQKMAKDPDYQEANKLMPILFTEHKSFNLVKMEEEFQSRWAEKIPGIAGSQRSYEVGMNKFRLDAYKSAKKSGIFAWGGREMTLAEKKGALFFIAAASGRADFGPANTYAAAAGKVFWTPRFVISRFQYITGFAALKGAGWRGKAWAAIEMGRYFAGLITYIGLWNWFHDKKEQISLNRHSSNLGKAKIGDTRIDVLSGIGQTVVFIDRVATGKYMGLDGQRYNIIGEETGFGKRDLAGVLGGFLRGKLEPSVGMGVNLLSGSNMVGEPYGPRAHNLKAGLFNWGKDLLPMSIDDTIDAVVAHGIPRGTAVSFMSLIGEGVQTYKSKPKKLRNY